MDKKKRVTVDLTERDLGRLRRIAAGFGLLNTTGPKVGHGSPQQLANALVSGRLKVVEATEADSADRP